MNKYLKVEIVEAEPVIMIGGKVYSTNEPLPIGVKRECFKITHSDGCIDNGYPLKETFEKNYRKLDGLTFGLALEGVKKGKGMRLPQWGKDVVIKAQYPDEHSKMSAPYLYVQSRFGCVPWKETMIELFAENWEIVE